MKNRWLPDMTNRWRNAAIAMAVLGFVSIAVKLVTRQYVTIAPCRMTSSGTQVCFEEIQLDPLPTLFYGVFNAAIWFGIVYLVFLVTYGLRKVVRGGSQPPPAAPSDVEAADPDKPEISPEP